jgi:hypothetical protein
VEPEWYPLAEGVRQQHYLRRVGLSPADAVTRHTPDSPCGAVKTPALVTAPQVAAYVTGSDTVWPCVFTTDAANRDVSPGLLAAMSGWSTTWAIGAAETTTSEVSATAGRLAGFGLHSRSSFEGGERPQGGRGE